MLNTSKYSQHLPTYKRDFLADSRWIKKETEHYIFHYFPDSVAAKEVDSIKSKQEFAYTKILNFLAVPNPDKKIKYYLYPDSETKKSLMGDDWYAQAIYDDFAIHVLYTEDHKPIGEHEDTHLLSLPLGIPISLFQEGLAEYLVGSNWFGKDFDDVSRDAINKGKLPNVESMMEQQRWFDLDDADAEYHYSFCGSFARFLIDKYGKEKFLDAYSILGRNNNKQTNIAAFQNVFGVYPSQVEKDWIKHLFVNY